MRRFKTHDGHDVLISDRDWKSVRMHQWHVYDRYVETTIDKKTVKLSRYILNAPATKFVDHRNGDMLDNRRCNLRFCTRNQNQWNRKRNANNTSGCKGVSRIKSGNFRARVQVNGERFHLGVFKTVIGAQKARRIFAKAKHGTFYKEK